MKAAGFSAPEREFAGITRLEVVVVLAILLVLLGLYLPAEIKNRSRANRIACVNNLKHVGIAFNVWAHEHDDKFPWSVSVSNSSPGTLELAESSQTWRHLAIVSNDLPSPKVLVCPSDNRRPASDWATLNNRGVSYLLNVDAKIFRFGPGMASSILSGDRNVTSSVKPSNGVLRVSKDTPLEWTAKTHNRRGMIGDPDGSVYQASQKILSNLVSHSFSDPTVFDQPYIRLAIPE